MSEANGSGLSLRTPPRYGRRAVWATLAALFFVGLSFCLDEAASNQLAASDMPTLWARYLAGISLYYAAICAFRSLRRRRVKTRNNQRRP